MQSELIKELEAIGLSEKESRVYLAVLEMGQATVQKIGKTAEVNRATTYVILESLMNKGLIATFGDGKKSLYIAEGPHALNNIIREQEEELEKRDIALNSLMPELHSLYNLHPNKPVVNFYDGKEGLSKMRKDFLLEEPDSLITFYSAKVVKEAFSLDENKKHREYREKRSIKIKAVFNGIEGGEQPEENKFAERIQLPEDQFEFNSDVSVFNDKVSMFSLKGHVSGVIIQSKEVSETIRSIFELAFEGAKIFKKEEKK